MVPVEVVEAPAVHEAVILRIGRVLAAGGDGLPHHLVHLRPAAAGEREQTFRVSGGIAQLAPGERLEERLGEKHRVRLLADDHAGRLLVGEPGVELETELREELHRRLHIPDRQVDEELAGIACHAFSPRAPNGLNPTSSRDFRGLVLRAASGFEILDSGDAAEIEEVLPRPAVAGPRSLAGSEVCEAVLDSGAGSEPLSTGAAGLEAAELLLQRLLLADVGRPPPGRRPGAEATQRAGATDLRIGFHHLARVEWLHLACRTGNGFLSHIDLEITFPKELGRASIAA